MSYEICLKSSSYKKSRGLSGRATPTIGIVVKFLPIPFAIIIATIILRVKPVEADFSKLETKVASVETLSYLLTEYGDPVDPTKMAETLSRTWQEVGLEVKLGDLRHALEAFAHKLQPFVPRPNTQQEVLVTLANHSTHSSSGYGRDQNSFGGVPADISEQNSAACNVWNQRILQSPSVITHDGLAMLHQQLEAFGMLSDGDMSILYAMCEGDAGLTVSSSTASIAAQGQHQPYGMGLGIRHEVRDGFGTCKLVLYTCVTFYQAPSPGIGGGLGGSPATSPTNVSCLVIMPGQGFGGACEGLLSQIGEVMNQHSVCDMSKKSHSRFCQVRSPGIGGGHAKSLNNVSSASSPTPMQRECLSGGSEYMVQDMRGYQRTEL